MTEAKTSQEVNYTANGELGKQCKDCINYVPTDETSGNCMGHNVSVSGSCNFFKAKQFLVKLPLVYLSAKVLNLLQKEEDKFLGSFFNNFKKEIVVYG